ncbi:MAG: TIGR01777 family oxidoreductase [Bacteroidales bacterium]|nr:TIGR01777 family oxidoreductase [Bacteroidales bacterium]
MKVLVIGATGFIGKPLVEKLLERNHEVFIFTRGDIKARRLFGNRVFIQQWDTDQYTVLQEYAHKVHLVINLAGENLGDKRWSEDQKRKIVSSRVNIGKAISFALKQSKDKPYLLIQASAIGYYGFSEDQTFTEQSPPGEGFLPMVTQQWEDSVQDVREDNTRKIFIRTGIVLGREGGILPQMLRTFRFFMGGPLGSGKQWISWIHIDDEVEAIVKLAEAEGLSGAYNLTAPNPVTMKTFAATLGKVMKRPSWLPVPAFLLKLVFGEMAKEMMLQGQRVMPSKLQEMGFEFQYPTLEKALTDLLDR